VRKKEQRIVPCNPENERPTQALSLVPCAPEDQPQSVVDYWKERTSYAEDRLQESDAHFWRDFNRVLNSGPDTKTWVIICAVVGFLSWVIPYLIGGEPTSVWKAILTGTNLQPTMTPTATSLPYSRMARRTNGNEHVDAFCVRLPPGMHQNAFRVEENPERALAEAFGISPDDASRLFVIDRPANPNQGHVVVAVKREDWGSIELTRIGVTLEFRIATLSNPVFPSTCMGLGEGARRRWRSQISTPSPTFGPNPTSLPPSPYFNKSPSPTRR
jgi:hypothetical protein